MRHNENKVMRCLWYAFLMVIILTFLIVFGYEMWNGTTSGMLTENTILAEWNEECLGIPREERNQAFLRQRERGMET